MTETIEPQILNMDQVKIDPRWALRIPANLAMRRKLLPFTQEGDRILVACVDPHDSQAFQAVERYLDTPVTANLADEASLERAIARIFREPVHSSIGGAAPTRVNIENLNNDTDLGGDEIVALGDEIFNAALIREATDIHIEPSQKDVVVRFRVDGMLEEYRRLPDKAHGPLLSRLKVLAGMDIAEKRAPQDGRLTLGREETRLIDVRAATIPTKQGERMTLRLLASNTRELTLEKLGMNTEHLECFGENITRPNGLVLLTGPTGCGKSTTLYAAIRKIRDRCNDQFNSRLLNIITIEDPVEYVMDGVSQVEVDTADKVNFHKALRSALRHDPDVLMIGEIRDELTAEIAIKAALTGHLVFSTIHTNSAVSSITRLIDMGVAPFLVSAVSRLFVAQRLVRKICQHCKKPIQLTKTQADLFHRPQLEGETIYQPVGCKYCAGTGYVGRTGIFEVLSVDSEISQMIANNLTEQEIQQYLNRCQFDSLFDDGYAKLKAGLTSFEEVATVVNVI